MHFPRGDSPGALFRSMYFTYYKTAAHKVHIVYALKRLDLITLRAISNGSNELAKKKEHFYPIFL